MPISQIANRNSIPSNLSQLKMLIFYIAFLNKPVNILFCSDKIDFFKIILSNYLIDRIHLAIDVLQFSIF